MSPADEFDVVKLRHNGEWGCTGCPVEAEGRLADGRPWYFRARSGGWALSIGGPDDEDAVCKPTVAQGDDPFWGWMPAKHAAALIHAQLDVVADERGRLRKTGQKRCKATGKVEPA